MRMFLRKHKFGTICSVFVCLILCFTIVALSVVPVMAGGFISSGHQRDKNDENGSNDGVDTQGNISTAAWTHGEDQLKKDEQESDLSLGDVASCAAWFLNYRFSKAKSSTEKSYLDLWSQDSVKWANNPGMAGAYVGFVKSGSEAADKNDTGSFLGVRFTKANVSYSFNTFRKMTFQISNSDDKSDPITIDSKPLRDYLFYGSVLKQLGIDKYGSANGTFITVVGGSITFGLYAAAAVVPKLMNSFIEALQFINPFGMLADSKELNGTPVHRNKNGEWVQGETTASSLTVENTSGNANESVFASFREWYGKLVDAIAGITWAILIPLFIVAVVVTFLLFKKTDEAKSKAKKLLIRIGFLAIGIPLLGALYTSTLDGLSEITQQPVSAADKAVVSTYVDFGSWAMRNNLQPPEAKSFRFTVSSTNNNTGEPSVLSYSYWRLKHYATSINSVCLDGINFQDDTSSGDSSDAVTSWTTESIKSAESGKAKSEKDKKIEEKKQRNASVLNSNVTDLLMRYISGSVITAGDYGSAIIGQYASSKVALIMLHDMDTYDEWKKFKDEDNNQIAQFLKNAENTEVRSPMNNGQMTVAADEGDEHGGGQGMGFSPFKDPDYPNPDKRNSRINDTGLSDVAMYNYLNSEFTSTGCNVFGANETVSIFSQNYHRRVNVIGTGFLSFSFWFNCICTLLAYAVVGWFYAFGMLFQNIKRTFMVLSKIPFAAFGILRSMAQVVAYGIIMLVEVFITILMYSIVMSMLETIPDVIFGTIHSLMSSSDSTSSGGLIAYLTISSFILIFLMIKSLSLRKVILKGIDEGINSVVARIFGTDNQLTPEANANVGAGRHALRNGMIAGAGMAMANRMLSPSKDGGKSDGKGSDGSEGADGTDGSSGASGSSGSNGSDGNGTGGPSGHDVAADSNDRSGQGFDTSDFGDGKDAKAEENKGRMAALRDSLGSGSNGGRVSDKIKSKAVSAQDAADEKHMARQNEKFGYAMDENGNIDRSKLSRGDRAKFDAGNALHKARGEGRALSAQARGAVTDKAGDVKNAAKRGAVATRDAVVGAAQAGGQHLKVGSAISSANRASKAAYKQAIDSGASQADAQKAASAARAKTLKAAGVTETMVREHDVKMKDVMKQGAAQARGNVSGLKSIKGSSKSTTVTDEVKANRKSVVKQGAMQTNVQPQGNSKTITPKGSTQRVAKTDTVKVDRRTNVQKGQNQLNGAAAFMGGMAMGSMMNGANKDTAHHVKSKNTIVYDAENVGRKGTTRSSGYRPGSQGSGTSRRQGSTSHVVTDNRQQFDTVNRGVKGGTRDEGHSSENAASKMSTKRRKHK